VLKVVVVRQVFQETQGQEDPKERKVAKDQEVPKVFRVQEAHKERLELLHLQVSQGQQELNAQQVHKDSKVPLVLLPLKVLKGHQGLRERREHRDRQALLCHVFHIHFVILVMQLQEKLVVMVVYLVV
jgi:hypothetical protein